MVTLARTAMDALGSHSPPLRLLATCIFFLFSTRVIGRRPVPGEDFAI